MLRGEGQPPNLWSGGICKIHCCKPSGGTGELIHQSAGLSKIFRFGKASGLGNLGKRGLSAAEKGLGTCWVCNFDAAQCARLLSLPADEEPVVLVPIGYPADEPAEKQRKPLSAIFSRMD